MKFAAQPIVFVLAAMASHIAAEPQSIIPADVKIEVVSQGDYRFVEGPALAPDGSIYFSDIPNNSIHSYFPETGVTWQYEDDSGGANGLIFHDGNLLACSGKSREIRSFEGIEFIVEDGWKDIPPHAEPLQSGGHKVWHSLEDSENHEVLTTHYEDIRLNSPNDLVSDERGIYFTDPRYGNRDSMEMKVEGVYYLSLKEELTNSIVRVVDNLVRPNGIGISPDFKTLYVADNGDKKIWAYPIIEPGQVGEGWVLNDLGEYDKGPDGMTVDHLGRIYTTIYNEGVLILSPEGERLGFIETGPQTTNCVFGADGKTLYVTAEKSLKRVVLNTGR